MESVGKLKPAFKKDGGVVTAANASGINDGASAVVIMSKNKAQSLNIKPLMQLVNICAMGVEPNIMGIGPAEAIPKCLKGADWKFDDVEYWEINEAFAPQFLAVELDYGKNTPCRLEMAKVNHNGSGLHWAILLAQQGYASSFSLSLRNGTFGFNQGGASLCVVLARLWHHSGR